MNHEIQPEYVNVKVTCGCGNTFETRSTRSDLRIEICGACHPFYTGRQKFVDTAGRIQRFQEKFRWDQGAADAKAKEKRAPKAKKTAATAGEGEE
ncbi:MAG: 50S ribosomal protein L31 [Planctomycetes bacterium]|nr:50S ribosomal protein L31 [Planctomycetota bacterium]MCW8140615.1 50S ribosomal protein L31 [Planctomycetota bacterium]